MRTDGAPTRNELFQRFPGFRRGVYRPFEFELYALARRIGLTIEQHRAVARFYHQQVNALLDLCIEITADEETDPDA